jgi:subtilisin family serine protease
VGQTEEYALHYPASYENVISVCAISCNGDWGKWATYHTTVDLAAPGDNIYSTIMGGGYQQWDGSSMASPNAASVMGLIWSYHSDWKNEDVVEQVKLAADSSIYDINPDYIDCNGNEGSYCLGAGMVDAHKAIGKGFSPNIYPYLYNFTEIIGAGDSDGIINPGESGHLTISLVNVYGWADAENNST